MEVFSRLVTAAESLSKRNAHILTFSVSENGNKRGYVVGSCHCVFRAELWPWKNKPRYSVPCTQSPTCLGTKAEGDKYYRSSGRNWTSLCVIATVKRSHYWLGELILRSFYFQKRNTENHLSQWQRVLRHEPSSIARTMRSVVRIRLTAWMSVWVYSVFVFCVQIEALWRADPTSKRVIPTV
jgi:hypothetical protein